jgi:hypothetical protein
MDKFSLFRFFCQIYAELTIFFDSGIEDLFPAGSVDIPIPDF